MILYDLYINITFSVIGCWDFDTTDPSWLGMKALPSACVSGCFGRFYALK